MSNERIVKIDYRLPHPDVVSQAVAVLKDGGFVVAPTETRYGLLARADSIEILKKLFALKQRPLSMPTAVFIAELREAAEFVEITELARQLDRMFLPGPLTLVLNTRKAVEAPLAAEGKMGFRISSAPVVAALLKGVDFPLTATSANRSGSAESETATEIAGLFGDKVALYLDAGTLGQPASTVVDCSTDVPEILRAGAISPEELFRALRKVNS